MGDSDAWSRMANIALLSNEIKGARFGEQTARVATALNSRRKFILVIQTYKHHCPISPFLSAPSRVREPDVKSTGE